MTDPGQPGAGAPAQGQPTGGAPPAPPATPQQGQAYKDLATKKGFKSEDDFAKSYESLETTHRQKESVWNKNKELLAQYGVQMDEAGNIIPDQSQGQPQQGAPVAGQDPFAPINEQFFINPTQVAMGLTQQMIQQWEKDSAKANQTKEDFFKANEEAAGFRAEIEALAMSRPVGDRTKADTWQNALLVVKGRHYNDAVRVAKEEALRHLQETGAVVSAGGAPPSGASGGQTQTTPALEAEWNQYRTAGGRIADKAEWMKYRTDKSGGR